MGATDTGKRESLSVCVWLSLRENHPADGAGVALLGNLQISPTHNTEMVCTGINRPTAGFAKTSEGNSSWVDGVNLVKDCKEEAKVLISLVMRSRSC